jgi:cold shock CspA family protein
MSILNHCENESEGVMSNAFERFFKGEGIPTEPDTTPVKLDEKRVTGKIIKVSDDGWGFISSKEIKFTRIFFHWTSLKQDTLKFTELKNGMRVEFTPVELEGKGFRAIKIRVLNEPT